MEPIKNNMTLNKSLNKKIAQELDYWCKTKIKTQDCPQLKKKTIHK